MIPGISAQFFHHLVLIDLQRSISSIVYTLVGRELDAAASITLKKKAHLSRAKQFRRSQ